ncbi:MAG: VWA domain-containing protein [Bryobacterales bacterium]|nr:VWA domain-containing protein [Bryobacterales bacterium]
MVRFFLAFAALLALLPVSAQQEPESPAIQANVPLVLAPVTVTDRKGAFIDGLTVDDFRLTDDGKPQKIRMDTSDLVVAPVSLVVLIQASAISAPALARIERVGGLIKPLVIGARGQAAVMEFDDELRLRTDFTTDSGAIGAAFLGIRSRSIRTARLLDAVLEGVKLLDTRSPNNRRVMLILSESRDRGSTANLKTAMEMAQRAGVVIYTATYSVSASAFASRPANSPSMPQPRDPGDKQVDAPRSGARGAAENSAASNVDLLGGATELGRLGKANVTTALARATGGRQLSFVTLPMLEAVISRAGEEIHSQYLLSFVPAASTKDGPHEIRVAIPSRPGAVIRVRPQYWPQK